MKLSRREFTKLVGAAAGTAALADLSFGGVAKGVVEKAVAAAAATPSEKWVKSACRVCSTVDYINVHVVDGMIDKIEGYADPIRTKGKLCARGTSGLWFVYDPYRVKVPLKRTNPQKGKGVDPKWVEISWDEAYNTIAEQAKKVRAKGKEGTMWISTFSRLRYTQGELYGALQQSLPGSSYNIEMGMNWCGHVYHYMHRVAHGGFTDYPDFRYCNYLLYFGREDGFVFDSMHMAEPLLDAHERGAKIVVLNPVMSYGGNVIDEWIPILPGTDGAFASAMLNVLIHELGIYDVDFIKKWTNGPYLIRSDNGYYARDATTNKPLVWDAVDNVAKTFDDPTVKDYALEGAFAVDSVTVSPSWQLLKDTVKSMTPEWAEPITQVPAGTIRRIAKEFGEAAQVGSTIVVDGVARPYRPVNVDYATNASNHVHGFANGWSIALLETILGAWDAVGSSCNQLAKEPFFAWNNPGANMRWKNTQDGLIMHPDASYTTTRARPYHFVSPPETVELEEYYPLGDHLGANSVYTMAHPDEYGGIGGKRRVEFAFTHCYSFLSMFAINSIMDILSTIPFLAASCIYMEEATDFADIVLPDRCYLEQYQVNANWLQQPVVEPLYNIPHVYDQFIEIAERTGCLYGKGGFNDKANAGLRLKPEYMLDLNTKYTTEQIFDRICMNTNGKGLDWWKENGGVPQPPLAPAYEWYKNVYQFFPGTERAWPGKQRLPIYVELHKRVADQLRTNMEKNGVKWDYGDFATLPKWIPSHLHKDTPPYDLIQVAYLQNTGGFMSTNANPVIADISEKLDPYGLYVCINEETAEAKGIADGDLILVESEYDKRQARAKLSQTIHPQVIAVSRHFGRWAGNPIIKSLDERHLGISHQALRPLKPEYIDKVNVALENCIKVKVSKVS